MKNISKVLRQLPEKPLRWLLQDFMKDGIPTQFEDLKNEHYMYFIYDFKLELIGDFIYLSGNKLYDIENNKPLLKPVKYQAPTPEQVKAIYEGVESIKSLMDNKTRNIDTKEITGTGNCMFDLKGRSMLYEKNKGFALPISWKEEEETTEQKGKRIQEENEKNLFDRVQALEEFTGINKGMKKTVFTRQEIERLQDRVHKIVGNGDVMVEFNKLLGNI